MLVNVLLVVGDEGLGDGLADGVDLGGVTTTGNADTDVDTGELVSANDEDGLVGLCGEKSVSGFLFFDLIQHEAGSCRTLKRRISGWTRERGWPLTLIRPLPCCSIVSFMSLP